MRAIMKRNFFYFLTLINMMQVSNPRHKTKTVKLKGKTYRAQILYLSNGSAAKCKHDRLKL